MDSALPPRSELKWVLTIAALAVVVANLPFALAALTAPTGTVYTGISSVAPGDLNVYLSYLEQVTQGHLVLRDLFTAEPQVATLINPFWLALGILGSLFRIAPLATYVLARLVLGFALVFVLYRFTSFFFDDLVRRRAALLLAVFASGIGAWVEPLLRVIRDGNTLESGTPMDLWVSEAFTFLSLRHSPHFLAVTILIVVAVWCMMRSVERSSMRESVKAGLALLALLSFHPFHVVSFAYITIAFLAVVLVVRRGELLRQIGRFAVMWFVATPAILYHALLILYDPFARGRSLQNILPTTSWWLTLVSYGFLLVGAAYGASLLLRTRKLRNQLLVAWLIAHAAAIYAPVFFNRRVTHGLNIALAMAAAAAVPFVLSKVRTMRWVSAWKMPLAAIVALLLLGLSNLWVMGQDLWFLFQGGRTMPSFFYMADDYRGAFAWLEANGDDSTVVLSGTITGNFVPARSGRRVVVGHNVETVDLAKKLPDVRKYFSPDTDDAWRWAYLIENRVTHVLVGPREEARGAFNVNRVPYLIPVYQRGNVTLYRVSR